MEEGSNLKSKVLGGSVVILIFTAISSLFGYVSRSFYSYALSQEAYGLFYAGIGLFNFIWAFTDFGFGYSTTLLLPRYIKAKQYNKAWNIFKYGQIVQLLVSFIISIVFILLAPYISGHYFKVADAQKFIYLLCGYLIANSFLGSLSQFFMGVQEAKYYSSLIVVRVIFALLFSLSFRFAGLFNASYAVSAWFLGYGITAIVYWLILHRKYSFISRHHLVWDKTLFIKAYKYALPSFLTILITVPFSSLEIVFLTYFRGIKEVGLYNIIFPLASISFIVLSPLCSLLLPLISSLMRGETDKVKYLVEKLYEIIPLAGFYFAVFLSIFSIPTIKIIFGDKWLEASNGLLGPASLAYVILVFANIVETVALGMGLAKERLKITVFVSFVRAALNLVLIMSLGIMGVIISAFVSASLMFIFLNQLIKIKIAHKIPANFYLKLLVMLVVICILFKPFAAYNFSWFAYLFLGIGYTMVFILLTFVFKLYDRKVINIIKWVR